MLYVKGPIKVRWMNGHLRGSVTCYSSDVHPGRIRPQALSLVVAMALLGQCARPSAAEPEQQGSKPTGACSFGWYSSEHNFPERKKPAPDLKACIQDLSTEMTRECRSSPDARVPLTGRADFHPPGGGDRTVQVLHATCSRLTAGKPVCFYAPCDPTLGDQPGCRPCPAGKTRDFECECVYPPGTEHSCTISIRTDARSWVVSSETSDLEKCRTEGERDMVGKCRHDEASGWADVSVNVWRNGTNTVQNYVSSCSDALAGKPFCHGPECHRPCPKDQCMAGGACVAPGGPQAGLCHPGADGVFCYRCK